MGKVSGNSSQDKGMLSRRRFFTGGLAAAAAVILGKVRPAQADDDVQPSPALLLGQENVADSTTELSQTGPSPTFRVENPDSGPGIRVVTNKGSGVEAIGGGISAIGGGVLGVSEPLSPTHPVTITQTAGVQGLGHQLGVVGAALPDLTQLSITFPGRAGVMGVTDPAQGIGVVGGVGSFGIFTVTNARVGVWGTGGPIAAQTTITSTRDGGVGVWGTAPPLPETREFSIPAVAGVVGTAFGPSQTAIYAHNPQGTALKVVGRMAISTGGRGMVPEGETSVEILDPNINAGSLVVVNLTSDPGNKGSALHHIVVKDGGLEVAMTAPPRNDTSLNYVCLELA